MPHTLLLADDSPAIHRVIELTFAGRPIEVVAVSEGTAAMARIQAAPPDIILVDVALPGRNGYDLAAYVKQTPGLAGIPVVLLTGAFEPVDEGRARASACDGVLAKPFDPEIVTRRVEELLNQRQRGDMSEAGVPAIQERPEPRESLDNYFERLDVSLTALGTRAPAAGIQAPPPTMPPAAGEPAAEPDFGATFATPAPSALAPRTSGEVETARPVDASIAGRPASLAEAFAALMEAERWAVRERTANGAPVGGAPLSPDGFDGVVEAIARAARQLVEQGGRDAVREIVSQVAERVIREEIARIKAEIGEQ